ncbi:MAG: TlpA family protein disulfide reductase [Verrucomicrobiales bacterium]|nr:TlpA family protein disulfide reductase [Verrucomicrobiales bacterium]
MKEKARGVLKKKAALGHPFDLSLTTTDGSELRLSDWRGKVVLVDFWASWCPPCRETLPELRQLHARLRSRGLEIVGISFDDDLDKLRRCVEAERILWKQSADGKGWTDSARARDLGLTSLPGLWLLDRQGVLRDVDAREGLEAKLERLLAAP